MPRKYVRKAKPVEVKEEKVDVAPVSPPPSDEDTESEGELEIVKKTPKEYKMMLKK
jgi:hypothetical protein